MWSILVLLGTLQAARAGVIGVRNVDACRECAEFGSMSLVCDMAVSEPVRLIISCHVKTVMTTEGLMVTELEGRAVIVTLARSTLECEDVLGQTVSVNGQMCPRKTTTETTTTTKAYRWIPVPFPIPRQRDEGFNSSASTTTMTTTTMTTTAVSTETISVASTTHLIAVSTAFRLNQTTIIITVVVVFAVVGTFVTFRCVRRRARRSQSQLQTHPLQVEEVSSTSDVPLSPRRRRLVGRRSGDSFESVELFHVSGKKD